ncbi:outer membrane beta-barrel protein [Ekhidna sp.]
MKKSFIVWTLVLCSLISYSQIKISFSTGMNVSNLTEDLVTQYGFDTFREAYIDAGGSATSEVKNSVRIGFYLAALADIPLNESVFIRSGLKYMNTGDSYFFKTDDVVLQSSSGSETDEKYKFRQRLSYLSIPLNMGKSLSKKIGIYGGVTPSINVGNIVKINYFEEDGDKVKQKWEKDDNPVDARGVVMFLNGGMNYFFIGDKVDYFIDFGFNYALSSVYDDPDAESIFKEANAWNIDLGFGIRL